MRIVLTAMTLAIVIDVAPPAPARESQPSSATGPNVTRAVGYYDRQMERVVLVGGPALAPGARDRVWSWSGERWELLTDAGPPGRTNAAAAFDLVSRQGIVAGGTTMPAEKQRVVSGDAWRGDGSTWQRIGDHPARDHQSMVTDGRGRVLMFGGIPADRAAPWPADTLELSGDRWVTIATDGPQPRGRSAMAYDAKRRQVVLFGGVTASPGPQAPQTFLNDTWVWENGKWRKAADGGPPGRYAHGMIYDERTGVVLLYGGAGAHKGAPLADMWQWDGVRWSEIKLTGPTPGYRYQPIMVYDAARQQTVLYGGIEGSKDDTWEWDGKVWTEIRP